MDSDRRFALIGVVVMFAAVGGMVLLGGNSQPATAESADLPDQQDVLLSDMAEEAATYHENAVVSAQINESSGEPRIDVVLVQYESDATSEEELMAQFRAMGDRYLNTLNKSDVDSTPTLVMRDTNVEATLAGPAIEAYQDGDLKRSAVLKSIEVTNIDRPEGGSSDDSN